MASAEAGFGSARARRGKTVSESMGTMPFDLPSLTLELHSCVVIRRSYIVRSSHLLAAVEGSATAMPRTLPTSRSLN